MQVQKSISDEHGAGTCGRCGASLAGDEPCPCSTPARTLAFGEDGTPAASEPVDESRPDPLVGTRVGSFEIVRRLGQGGMGTVYLAEHPVIGSRVAVKFLHESMAADPAVVTRFYDEARAVNLIGHENIVAIYDLSVLPPNRYFYVMEYLEGATLGALVRPGPLALDAATGILLQLCDALQCAHERGVVHRDLKPENVFLVPRGGRRHFVKLVDFGIAKLRDERATRETRTGLIVGTPEYMAPEQCDGRAVDARTDVYALGVIAYELATGRLPFRGATVGQLLLAHLRERPPAPSQVAPRVTPALGRILLRALEKDPAHRFPDMASFAAALRSVATPVAPAPAREAPRPAARALVRSGTAPARELPVEEITRAGLFLRADSALPPLRSRVEVSLAHPTLRAPVALAGEVVRHVTSREAAAWKMAPGFAVQLVELTPEARAALVTVGDAVRDGAPAPSGRAPPAPAPGPTSPAAPQAPDLAALEARAAGSHYEFLGVAPDAEFADVRRAARALHDALEAVRARPVAADQPARAAALLARVEAAHGELAAPAPRLAHDAQRGNFLGVARCLAAGVPAALVDARRRAFLAANPVRAGEAQRQRARAEVARKLGNGAAALVAYEASLAADPLDAATLETYLALRRERSE